MNKNDQIEIINLPVEGMTCASCVARVEKSIASVDGVQEVSVNFASETASVRINTTKTDIQKIKNAVEDAGYKINLITDSSRKSDEDASENQKSLFETGLKKDLIIALIFSIPVIILNMGTMWSGFLPLINLSQNYINKILLILTTPVVFISGRRFYTIFWKNLKHLSADMNSLVAIGTGAAYLFSVVVTLFPDLFTHAYEVNHVYYDTTVVIITLILLGRWLESRAKSKTGSAIKKLISLKPQKVIVRRDNTEFEINIENLVLEDTVIIKPGNKIPADGIVKNGYSTIDESMITGESIPSEKIIGSKIIGGTINKTGTLEFTVTALGEHSVLGKIIRMVEQAQGSKAHIQQLADKVAAVFVPAIILTALFTFIGWLVFGDESVINNALLNFIAVLIIACPCALGLATPTALIVGIGKGASKGILIKNAESLEQFHKIDTLIFDKTGTLTTGKPAVVNIENPGISKEKLIQLCASLEQRSEHPIGRAIVNYAYENNIGLLKVQEFESLTGFGLKGKVNGEEIIIGNKSLIQKSKVIIEQIFQENNNTASLTKIYVSINNKLCGIISVQDPVREEAFDIIQKLKRMNINTVMLTGDNKSTAEAVAAKTGIDEIAYELLPEDKIDIVKKYQRQNKIVAMVGDGINDAPALAQSDLAIAVGSGTDVAIDTGDIVLVKGNLNGVLNSFILSKNTIRTIKQNLFWAFIYNIIGIPLAAFGILNPMIAALAMSFSSVSVVTNSLRLRKLKL